MCPSIYGPFQSSKKPFDFTHRLLTLWQYLNDLYSAVSLAETDYASLQSEIQQTFDPANTVSNLLLTELLTAFATLVLVVAKFAAGAEVGVAIGAGALANVVAGGIGEALAIINDGSEDQTWAKLGSNEQ